MKYSLDKYDYFQYKDVNGKTTIAAMSTYAGRRIKGYAKCDPRDTMNVQKGRTLAAARCNEKIADKRVKRAQNKYHEAQVKYKEAEKHLEHMTRYYLDSVDQLNSAQMEVDNLLSEM